MKKLSKLKIWCVVNEPKNCILYYILSILDFPEFFPVLMLFFISMYLIKFWKNYLLFAVFEICIKIIR